MSSDTIEFKRAEQRKKRGSRVWLAEKLNAIEALAGFCARSVAADKWADLVWDDPHEAAFGGADVVEQIYNLSNILQKIKDPAAADRISEIIHGGDDEQIKKVGAQLGSERIKKAVQMQTMDEEQICRIAQPYCTRKNPTGHLKARKHLRKEAKQGTALLNMNLGLVGHDGHHHATPHELKMRNDQKGRWRKFGESVTLQRGEEEISMLDVMKSAGEKKLAETLTLTKGLENYAKATGLTWAFITLTAPARMHPNPANGKSSWDGTTPDQAHNWIKDAAKRAVSRLLKKGIVISGLRVVESHLDGCPHWHLLVFAPPDQMPLIEAAYNFQPEWKSAPGMTFVLNDGTASAVSYIFKYITKTINSIEMIAGEAGFVDAWRSTWGIRAFAFFGMPPISLWRDFRAVKECPPTEPLIAEMWRAAHSGDGHAFIRLNGGLNVARKDRPVISRTTGDDKTKTIEFILQDTAESIRFDFMKWQQTRKEPESRASARVEVILNYPRKTEPNTSPPLPRPPGGLCWAKPRPNGGIHCHAPIPPNLGKWEKQPHHNPSALVGALPDRIPTPWWEDIDMKKAPSLAKFNEIRKKTGKAIYSDFPLQQQNALRC